MIYCLGSLAVNSDHSALQPQTFEVFLEAFLPAVSCTEPSSKAAAVVALRRAGVKKGDKSWSVIGWLVGGSDLWFIKHITRMIGLSHQSEKSERMKRTKLQDYSYYSMVGHGESVCYLPNKLGSLASIFAAWLLCFCSWWEFERSNREVMISCPWWGSEVSLVHFRHHCRKRPGLLYPAFHGYLT